MGTKSNQKFDTYNKHTEYQNLLREYGRQGKMISEFYIDTGINERWLMRHKADDSRWEEAYKDYRHGMKAFWYNVLRTKALSGDTQAIIYACKAVANILDVKKNQKINISFDQLDDKQKLQAVERYIAQIEAQERKQLEE